MLWDSPVQYLWSSGCLYHQVSFSLWRHFLNHCRTADDYRDQVPNHQSAKLTIHVISFSLSLICSYKYTNIWLVVSGLKITITTGECLISFARVLQSCKERNHKQIFKMKIYVSAGIRTSYHWLSNLTLKPLYHRDIVWPVYILTAVFMYL